MGEPAYLGGAWCQDECHHAREIARPAGLGICDRCGKTADVVPDLSEGQDALPGLDGGAA